MTSVVMHQYAEVESPTFDIKKMSMSIEMDSDRGTNSQEECCHSHVSYCVGQTDLKGEDVVFVEHKRAWPGRVDSSFEGTWANVDKTFHYHSCTCCGHVTSEYSLFCVFDGHNGKHAAAMAGERVLEIVEKHLPRGNPPAQSHPDYFEWRHLIQRALAICIVELNSLFAERGIHAGCTATIVLVTNWLVTSANLGDSHAFLDTGTQLIALTADHRVAADKKERRRVELTGAVVAPVSISGYGPADEYSSGMGPLRVWPGGLSIARAIGDFDVGPSIVPFSHVVQVSVPTRGARLLVGSDGIWDAFSKRKVPGAMTRSWSTNAAPSKMIQAIVRMYGNVKDDTSLIVADIMPKNHSFPEVVSSFKKKSIKIEGVGSMKAKSSSSGSLCFCFGSNSGSKSNLLSKAEDDSARSGSSAASFLGIENNHSVACLLNSVDIAEALDLIPDKDTTLELPEWINDEMKHFLLEAAQEATDTWLDASGRKPKPSISPPRRSKVAFAIEPAIDEGESMSTGYKEDKKALQRVASSAFEEATVEDTSEYAAKFGHYNSRFGTSIADPSVRAGRVYNTEASVRAGKAAFMTNMDDPSVRFRGSSMEGSLHMKARELAIQSDDSSHGPDDSNNSEDNMHEKKDIVGDEMHGLPHFRSVKRTGSSAGKK